MNKRFYIREIILTFFRECNIEEILSEDDKREIIISCLNQSDYLTESVNSLFDFYDNEGGEK